MQTAQVGSKTSYYNLSHVLIQPMAMLSIYRYSILMANKKRKSDFSAFNLFFSSDMQGKDSLFSNWWNFWQKQLKYVRQ